MPKTAPKTTKPTDPAAVDAFLRKLKHPQSALAAKLRATILAADSRIGEEIKWHAPAFFFTGPMPPFDPKEYRRHLVIFNFSRRDCIRLVFWHGDRAKDKSRFLEGEYADGRRLAVLSSLEDLRAHKTALRAALKAQLRPMR